MEMKNGRWEILKNIENHNFHCFLISTEAINKEGRDEQGF